METTNYSLKEVLLGTREEYLKIANYLKLLRELTTSYDRQVEDFYFKVYKNKGEDRVKCIFRQNEKTLKGLTIHFQKKLGVYMFGPEVGVCTKGSDGIYRIKSRDYEASILTGEEQRFDEVINQLLTSDFLTKTNFGFCSEKGMCNGMYLYPEGIYSCYVLQQSENKNKHVGHIEYNSLNDRVKVRFNNSEMPFRDKLKMVLEEPDIPESVLSEYHKQIIEQSGVKSKKLEISEVDDDCRNIDLSVEEDKETITLKRALK